MALPLTAPGFWSNKFDSGVQWFPLRGKAGGPPALQGATYASKIEDWHGTVERGRPARMGVTPVVWGGVWSTEVDPCGSQFPGELASMKRKE
jgi:hypothetical protein